MSQDITLVSSSKTQIADPLASASDQNMASKRKYGPESSDFGMAVTAQAVAFASEALIACENQLNTMDSGAGDSDCGSTLGRVA